MSNPIIALLVGSLREGSYSQAIGDYLLEHWPNPNQLVAIDLEPLTLFHQGRDDRGNPDSSWQTFRQDMAQCAGAILITPEYNRSIPALLKNALDIGSRPPGKSVWGGKPAGIISSSPGSTGGFGANHHLRQVLTSLDMPTLQNPQLYLGQIHQAIDGNGEITNEKTRQILTQFMEAYLLHFSRYYPSQP